MCMLVNLDGLPIKRSRKIIIPESGVPAFPETLRPVEPLTPVYALSDYHLRHRDFSVQAWRHLKESGLSASDIMDYTAEAIQHMSLTNTPILYHTPDFDALSANGEACRRTISNILECQKQPFDTALPRRQGMAGDLMRSINMAFQYNNSAYAEFTREFVNTYRLRP